MRACWLGGAPGCKAPQGASLVRRWKAEEQAGDLRCGGCLTRARTAPSPLVSSARSCKGALPIPGAKNAAQVAEIAGALGWRLSDAEVAELDAVSAKIPSSTGAVRREGGQGGGA